VTDKAFEKDIKNFQKKVDSFRKAAKTYLKTLADADTADETGDYAVEFKVLAGHLEAIEG